MAGLAVVMKFQRIRHRLVASVLPLLENLNEDKHVESTLFPRLDEGSIPSCSTHADAHLMRVVAPPKAEVVSARTTSALFVSHTTDALPKPLLPHHHSFRSTTQNLNASTRMGTVCFRFSFGARQAAARKSPNKFGFPLALHYLFPLFVRLKLGCGSEKLKQVWLFSRLALTL